MSLPSPIEKISVAAWVALLAISLSPTSGSRAWAQDPPETRAPEDTPITANDKLAREHYLRGERYYADGDYDSAIQEFKKAYDLSGRSKLLFNLANSYERLANYEEALEMLRQYAKTAPEFEYDSVARRIRNLETRADEKAERDDNDQPASTTRIPAVDSKSAAPTQDKLVAPPRVSSASSSTPTLGWVLVGTGIVLTAGGATSGYLALQARDDADALCQQGRCSEEAKSSLDDDKLYSAVSDIGIGLGVTTVLAGIYLVWRHDTGEEQSPVSASVQSNGINLSYSGSF